MNENKIQKSFNKRAFTSVGLFISGLLLPFSGLMIHILQFEKLTLAGHFWMSVHDVSGILFVIFSFMHITFNWKALINYSKKAKDIVISKEALIAIILILSIVGLLSSHAFHINN
jgi:succinate dehydrogenase/fumarate reductase cytochrome b subunit